MTFFATLGAIIAAGRHHGEVAALRENGIEADLMACSEEWGIEKPAPEFFRRLIAAAGVAAERIAYVGDSIDNDVLPAKRAGMTGIFVRRGPWGVLQASSADAGLADLRIEGLNELPEALSRLHQTGAGG